MIINKRNIKEIRYFKCGDPLCEKPVVHDIIFETSAHLVEAFVVQNIASTHVSTIEASKGKTIFSFTECVVGKLFGTKHLLR